MPWVHPPSLRRGVTSAGQVGLMEHWNNGFGGKRSVFMGLAETKKIKSDIFPHLIPKSPFFHRSIIP
jgi:hypothetical protein